jgi:hypothetical protein
MESLSPSPVSMRLKKRRRENRLKKGGTLYSPILVSSSMIEIYEFGQRVNSLFASISIQVPPYSPLPIPYSPISPLLPTPYSLLPPFSP